MNTKMRISLKKIDKLISKKGFVYALIMAQIEDITKGTIYNLPKDVNIITDK